MILYGFHHRLGSWFAEQFVTITSEDGQIKSSESKCEKGLLS